MIIVNGKVVAQGSQFSLDKVEVITATVDLEEIRAYRSSQSRALQAARSPHKYHRIQTDFELSPPEADMDIRRRPTLEVSIQIHTPEEEIYLASACWLWQYLTKAGAAGE